ncbi:hypothetical protein DNG35_03030 [Mesonia sp. K7]|nr:hypothetical protein DNG35_03030 [Mesonia sp. K7]
MNYRSFVYFFFALVLVSSLSNCAKRGRPTGGPQDTLAPQYIRSSPENYTTNFNAKEIRIYFDEYIKLDNPQQQIIFSPPINPRPVIGPMGLPRKYISLEINDTLQPNTTYTINFGKSIVDNNENNPLPYFKYVFSTGDHLDSLQIRGSVKDAFEKDTEEYISVLLYEINEAYTDSIPYKELPIYIGYTQDSTTTFTIENMKAGKYRVIAMKDNNSNYLFEPNVDKIGFLEDTLVLPSENALDITIFKEQLDFKVTNIKQNGAQKILLGYEGLLAENFEASALNASSDFTSRFTEDIEKDTIYLWYAPKQELDSLVFEVKQDLYRDTLMTRLKELYKDTLTFTALPQGKINFYEKFQLQANVPITKVDSSKISILNKDSLSVAFTTNFLKNKNTLELDFAKAEDDKYAITVLPEAFTDYFDRTNDTLSYRVSSPKLSDLGTLRINLSNLQEAPVIVELIENKKIIQRKTLLSIEENSVFFESLKPAKYKVRFIFDTNQNERWDTGSFLKKIQPEEIRYFPTEIEVRANWDVVERFSL